MEERRSKEIKRFSKLAIGMDDVCANIYVILIGTKRLRVNELYRALCRLGMRISKETLYIHLNHLRKQDLILREKEGKQKVAWTLNENHPIEKAHAEDVRKYVERWVESLGHWKETRSGLPPPPRGKRFDAKESYEQMPEHILEREIDRDIQEALLGNLFELKAVVDYDLNLENKDFKSESDADFWKFIGNPLYRLFEKAVAQNCRVSDRYRKKFFEKIDSRIAKLESEFHGEV